MPPGLGPEDAAAVLSLPHFTDEEMKARSHGIVPGSQQREGVNRPPDRCLIWAVLPACLRDPSHGKPAELARPPQPLSTEPPLSEHPGGTALGGEP